MADLREPNVGVTTLQSPSSSSSNLISPSSVAAELWDRAEEATQNIISRVQPTSVSELRRKEVVFYVQWLLRDCLGCKVFPFGSVPLKTYLPDGDIDLTAFGGANFEDSLANDLVSVLEREDQNRAAEFVVKDVQLIRAEVKIVKCIVQNIVVDISFNQLGGLCTLCFLEQVDRLIGKDHLFKRSIILIKAWCYYESRILGAHHGLISTYALETLVLYIFHLFHSTLNGPLAVLYKFLDYFSKFDWDNYCISLTGPVRISSLPEIVADVPENGGSDLLLSNDFIRYCMDAFSVPSRAIDMNSRAFPPKHLNIVDPLKENNNLGRSVSKGNFYRIRSAFMYGARKLGRVLLQPEDNIAYELRKFFSNTLDRHGGGQRPDVQGPFPPLSPHGFGHALQFTEPESCDNGIAESKHGNSTGIPGEFKLDSDRSFHDGDDYTDLSGMGRKISRTANDYVNGLQKDSTNMDPSTVLSESDGSAKRAAVLGYRCSGDAQDLATSGLQGLKISNGSLKFFPPSIEESVSAPGIAFHVPHLYFSGSISGNGQMTNGSSDLKEPEHVGSDLNTISSGLLRAPVEETDTNIDHDMEKDQLIGNHEVPSCPSEDLQPGYRERISVDSSSLSDLCGDYDSHLSSLRFGRWCFEYALGLPALPMPPLLPSHFPSKNPWDGALHPSQFKRNGFSLTNSNGVFPRQVFYPMNTLGVPCASLGMEEMSKPRGTGTYFPNTNRPPYQKPLTPRGRNQHPLRSPRNNGRPVTPIETNLLESSSHELAPPQFPVDQDGAKPGFSEAYLSGLPGGQTMSPVNGFALQSEAVVEFASVGQVPLAVPSLNQTSSQSLKTPGMQRPKPLPIMTQERVTVQSSYHLKDDEDFPPLSV